MQLVAIELLASQETLLLARRQKLKDKPGMALIWVGDDTPTATFVHVKQKKAKQLDCYFSLHQFPKLEQRQAEALVESLNHNKLIDGIVVQLPLPGDTDLNRLINRLDTKKDIDGLTESSRYLAPTALGIIQLLEHHHLELSQLNTVILGAGRLVGQPLAEMFTKNHWPFVQINKEAEKHIAQIQKCDLLISCTGVKNLVSKEMVNSDMIVIDGSGYDVDVDTIEPLVKSITPKKGAIGPLTVNNLFSNLLDSASS